MPVNTLNSFLIYHVKTFDDQVSKVKKKSPAFTPGKQQSFKGRPFKFLTVALATFARELEHCALAFRLSGDPLSVNIC